MDGMLRAGGRQRLLEKTGMAVLLKDRYDRVTIGLHWATALLVPCLWIVGQTADFIPDGPLNTFVWSTHVTFGAVLALILMYRIIWRSTSGHVLPAADRGALHVIAKATHYALYALLVITVVLGVTNAFVRHYNMFGLFKLPQLGDPEWKKPVTRLHGLAADGVMVVALLHSAAALVHQFVWRDGLLDRMIVKRGEAWR